MKYVLCCYVSPMVKGNRKLLMVAVPLGSSPAFRHEKPKPSKNLIKREFRSVQ